MGEPYDFAEWFADELEKQHLSAAEFARISGITPVSVHYYLTGQRQPNYNMLVRVLDALGMEIKFVDKKREQK